jgi:hypothetical protein
VGNALRRLWGRLPLLPPPPPPPPPQLCCTRLNSMGGGASKGGSSAVRGGGAYLKTDVFNDKAQELERQNRELRKELDDVRRELGNKMEDLRHSHEEMEDLTAQSFTRVKEQLTRTERETKGLRSEVSHATACVGKMGGAVRKQRTGAQSAEGRLEAAEASVQEVAARLGRAENALGDVDVADLQKSALARIDECEQVTLELRATTAKHTMTLGKQYEELTTHKKDTSSDGERASHGRAQLGTQRLPRLADRPPPPPRATLPIPPQPSAPGTKALAPRRTARSRRSTRSSTSWPRA